MGRLETVPCCDAGVGTLVMSIRSWFSFQLTKRLMYGQATLFTVFGNYEIFGFILKLIKQ